MADPPLIRRRPIVLVGIMGAGKSTVGRLLATMLELPFFDSDEEAERAAGRSVAQLFAEGGEAAFRLEERRAMARLTAGPPAVIAAGGGALIDPETRAPILERCIAVWLKADAATLARRLGGCSARPLLQRGDPKRILQRLLAEREVLYAAAPIHLPAADESPDEIGARIARPIVALPSGFEERGPGADCRA